MILINTSNLKKSFGNKTLFDKVSFSIESNDKIGLVGANAAGKTTLFKILMSETDSNGGEIFKSKDTKTGYMKQQISFHSTKTVWDEIMTVYSHIIDIEKRLGEITNLINKFPENAEKLTQEQHRLNEEYAAKGGFVYKNTAKVSLLGLGFKESDFNTPFSSLSGGEQTRVVLCKLLLSESNLLFLDEPTNHLDIEAIEWLEAFLKDYKGAFAVISHDRFFLDKVTNKTFELENNKLTIYKGNYSSYKKQKEEREKTLLHKYQNTTKEINRIEKIIEQQKRWNKEKNIKTAQSKQKQIDRLAETLEKPSVKQESIKFSFNANQKGGKDILSCKNLKMNFGSNILFENADIDIKRGERVFLLGPNGCGKTTLFKIILGEINPTDGSVKKGEHISIGYFDQKQQNLNDSKEAIEEIWDAYPKMTQTQIRNAMASFLFKGDSVFTPISSLSGGEKARIALLKLMLSGSDFLILDEPTNHLDIKSREALENALEEYCGTLFIISHDRYFINKLATKIYFMENRLIKLYNGDYSYFKEHQIPSVSISEKADCISESKQDYKNQKKRESNLRKLKNLLCKTEEKIEITENEISSLEADLMLPQNATDFVKSMDISKTIENKKIILEKYYEDWEKYSDSLSKSENM
ncbi:MAG: ABC-F family ATP-binding cassette domain-containing protein [Clostridia bacterium]|nr:ABC-F family ATP-binding cassette domain-containing protein [Clostridia bacterium]